MGAGLASRTLDQFTEDLKKAAGTGDTGLIRQRIHQLLKAMAISGESYAKRNYGKNGLGVVTGHLKQSINFSALTSGGQMGVLGRAGNDSQVRYAAVHEFGYGPIPPRPYITPAMEYLRGKVTKDLQDIFRSSVLGKSPKTGRYF